MRSDMAPSDVAQRRRKASGPSLLAFFPAPLAMPGRLLRPGDQPQLVRLVQLLLRRDHADIEPVSAALERRDGSGEEVVAVFDPLRLCRSP